MTTLQKLLDDLWDGGSLETGRTLALAKDAFVGYTASAVMKGTVVIKGWGDTPEDAMAMLQKKLKVKAWRKTRPIAPVTKK